MRVKRAPYQPLKWRDFVGMVESAIKASGKDPDAVEIDFMDFDVSGFDPAKGINLDADEDDGVTRLYVCY